MDDYNYATFDLAREEPYFEAFRGHLHAGTNAPDYPLSDLETGETVRLAESWRKGFAILEFGSFT